MSAVPITAGDRHSSCSRNHLRTPHSDARNQTVSTSSECRSVSNADRTPLALNLTHSHKTVEVDGRSIHPKKRCVGSRPIDRKTVVNPASLYPMAGAAPTENGQQISTPGPPDRLWHRASANLPGGLRANRDASRGRGRLWGG